jgi:hypothetical protein
MLTMSQRKSPRIATKLKKLILQMSIFRNIRAVPKNLVRTAKNSTLGKITTERERARNRNKDTNRQLENLSRTNNNAVFLLIKFMNMHLNLCFLGTKDLLTAIGQIAPIGRVVLVKNNCKQDWLVPVSRLLIEQKTLGLEGCPD